MFNRISKGFLSNQFQPISIAILFINFVKCYLQKSLPLLRQSLFSKELVIEGIKPPPQHVVGIINSAPSLAVNQHFPVNIQISDIYI